MDGGQKEGPRRVRTEVAVSQEEPPRPKAPEDDIFAGVVQRLREQEQVEIVVDTGETEGFAYDEQTRTAVRMRNVYIVPRGVEVPEEMGPRVTALNDFMIEVRNDLYDSLQLGDCLQVNEATGEEGRAIQTGAIYIVKDPTVFQEVMLGGMKAFEAVPQTRGKPVEGYRQVEVMRIAVFPSRQAVQIATALS